MMRPALRMLAQRFVFQHDVYTHEELKRINDRHRYDGYGYMLGIATEAWPPNTLVAPNCFSGHGNLDRVRFAAGHAVRSGEYAVFAASC